LKEGKMRTSSSTLVWRKYLCWLWTKKGFLHLPSGKSLKEVNMIAATADGGKGFFSSYPPDGPEKEQLETE